MNNKKITIKDLIAKKDKNNKVEKQELYVKSLDGIITVIKPNKEVLLTTIDQKDNGDAYLVYQSVIEPNLKDTELQKQFDCVQPMDIADKIFEIGEVSLIAQQLTKLAGYDEDCVKVVDEIKN